MSAQQLIIFFLIIQLTILLDMYLYYKTLSSNKDLLNFTGALLIIVL